ncbi:MAG TPA: M15 family metallopeptidase [Candidatus Doudnabacteria bacterium]|nr:M15 family metallopeptidase [Candidatus Doudnabacteria bacterium]
MMTRDEAINHPQCSQEILETLELVDVQYYGFDGEIHEGQIVVHHQLKSDVIDLFALMFGQKFPLQEVSPIVKYNWDDETSMVNNNTSGFNFRKIVHTDRISLHGYGFAIDINPRINPVIENGKVAQPANGSYNIEVAGTLYEEHPVVKFMEDRGWEWGGNWTHYQDYQHFQKKVK